MANALNKVNSGGIEDGSIVNADVKSDAAIAKSKLAALNIGASDITDDTITEAKLDISNTPSDGQYLQYKDSSDKLTWATVTTADATKMPLAGGTFTGSVIHNYTDAVQLPAGTTAQRPGTASAGDTRFNTTTSRLEFYTGSAWKVANTEPEVVTVDYLVIGGGGAGGGSWRGGGGGAGGYRNSYNNEASGGGGSSETALSLTLETAYSVIVGAGGVGVEEGIGGKGGDSTLATITSTGGGGGANYCAGAGYTNGSGGSGGGQAGCGSTTGVSGGAGTANQGYAGGASPQSTSHQCGGGGGGAGAAGVQGGSAGTAGDGGNGLSSSITGSAVTRAGGGGGGAYGAGNNAPIAGTGGAGPGTYSGGPPYANGANYTVQNSGSGGGGAPTVDGDNDNTGGTGGTGAKGVVIIRIPDTNSAAFTNGVTQAVGSPATVGADKVYTVINTSDSSQTVTFS